MKKISELILLAVVISMSSCIVSKTSYDALNDKYDSKTAQYKEKEKLVKELEAKLDETKTELNKYKNDLSTAKALDEAHKLKYEGKIALLEKDLDFLRSNIEEGKNQKQKLVNMGSMASKNLTKALDKLAQKEEYIYLQQATKQRVDSTTLVLSTNLKVTLKDEIENKGVDVTVDKTAILINLSDNILFTAESYELKDSADAVLRKIASVIQSNDDIKVTVEGHTNNAPIDEKFVKDNWVLSVLRSTTVVKALQQEHNVNPNKLIAAGRGEYNAIASNDTEEGKSMNKRTTIIILPKQDELYNLLKPIEE